MTYLKTITVPWIKKYCSYFPPGNFYLIFLLLTTLFFTLSSFDFHKNNNKGAPPKKSNSTNKKSIDLNHKTPFVGGDFKLNFTAAAPLTYDHSTGGGAYDDGTIGRDKDIVKSLEGGDFSCSDIVTFLTQVVVDDAAVGTQTIDVHYQFTTNSTGQPGVGLCDIIDNNVKINYGPVSGGDGPGGTDAGMGDNGNSTATLISESGTCFDDGDPLKGTVRITGLEGGDTVIVRVDVRISCDPNNPNPTGNLQAAITSAETVGPDADAINVGNQTIPFKNVNKIVCKFEVSCPTNTYLGTFDCTNLDSIPPTPGSIQDLKDLGFTIGEPCDTAIFRVSDSGNPNICSKSDQTITRTIIIWDDLNDNNTFDPDTETGDTCYLTFKVKADTIAPAIQCPDSIKVECYKDIPAPDTSKVTAYDNCSSKVLKNWVKDSSTYGSCPRYIYRIYSASDSCGNTTYCKQVIRVWDKTAPTIHCPDTLKLQCYKDIPYPDTSKVQAWDNCGKVWKSWVKDSSSYGSCPRYIYRTYKVKDSCGNTAYCKQVIRIWDKTAPTIQCPDTLKLQCYKDIPAPDTSKVKAWDNCGGKVWKSWVKDSSSYGSCPRYIYRTYKAKDSCGNTAYCKQVIRIWDKTPPTIQYCAKDTTISCWATIPPVDIYKVKASDNCGGKVWISHVKDSSTYNVCPRIIYRTYQAKDSCGNKSYCKQKIYIECCVYCTYTQGYWGNRNGLAKLPSLLTTPLTIGRNNYSIVIPANTSSVQSAAKLNSMMPGGGSPAVLNYNSGGPCSIMNTNCINQYLTSQKRFNNVLLAQTITLSLNVRLTGNGNLSTFPIKSTYITTANGGCVKLNSNVVNYLTANGTKNATISDLLNLANDVLGRVKPAGSGGVPSLSDINSAIDAINNIFDECKKFTGYQSYCPTATLTVSATEDVKGVQQGADLKVDAYPNPFNDRVQFVIHSSVSGKARLEVFSLLGQKLQTVYDGNVSAGKGQTVEYKVPAGYRTNLIYRVTLGDRVVTGKLLNIK
jgi:hypothetical protein